MIGRSMDNSVAHNLIDPEDVAGVALRLLEIASPPGHERAVADFVADELQKRGVDDVEPDEKFEGSPSVIARISGPATDPTLTDPTLAGPTLQWHGHLDAIATPHAPAYRDGDALHGRGASDMKGALAAMIVAAGAIARHTLLRRGSLLLTFHGLHEEGGNAPLLDLIDRGITGDAVIIGELGSADTLITSSPGLTFWDIEIDTSHPSVHETLRSDATDAADACLAITHELQQHAADRSTLGGSLFIGAFNAGDYHNRVPTRAHIKGTLRHTASEQLTEVHAALQRVIADATPVGLQVKARIQGLAEAYRIDPDIPIARALRGAYADATARPMRQQASSAVGNAHHFVHLAGIPAVYYGSDYATAHSDHEVASIEELTQLARIYVQATARYLHDDLDDVPELATDDDLALPSRTDAAHE